MRYLGVFLTWWGPFALGALDATQVFFGVRNLAVTLDGQTVGSGEGAFLVLSNGVVGIASGSVSLSAGEIQAGASGNLRVNSTGATVNTSVTIDGQVFGFNIPGIVGDVFFDLQVTDASLNIGGFVIIEGSISGGVITGNIFLGQGPTHFADNTVNPRAFVAMYPPVSFPPPRKAKASPLVPFCTSIT